jgi:hypothetical protein
MACMQARWRGRLGPGAWGTARGRGDGAHSIVAVRATGESWKAFDQQINLNNSQMENRLKSI